LLDQTSFSKKDVKVAHKKKVGLGFGAKAGVLARIRNKRLLHWWPVRRTSLM